MWRIIEKHVLAMILICCCIMTFVMFLIVDDIIYEIKRCKTDTLKELEVFKSYADDALSLMTDPTAISMRRSDFFVMLQHIQLRRGCCPVDEPSPSNSTVI